MDIVELAAELGLERHAGCVGSTDFCYYLVSDFKLRSLVARVAEECAKVCEGRAVYYRGDDDGPRGDDDPGDVKSRRTVACEACAAAIRAKFKA